jgi:hypothetical protein
MEFCDRELTLPLHAEINKNHIETIVGALKRTLTAGFYEEKSQLA